MRLEILRLEWRCTVTRLRYYEWECDPWPPKPGAPSRDIATAEVVAMCRRCEEMVRFDTEDGKLVAYNVIDGELHPCVDP